MSELQAAHIPPDIYAARRKKLVDLIVDLKEHECMDEIAAMLSEGWNPIDLLESCIQGMQIVGKRFEEGKYYIAALIMAGFIMRQTTEFLEPHLSATQQKPNRRIGVVLLGTISGDIHDLGKNLFAILAKYNSIEVVDLGVDVPPEKFCEEAKQVEPDLIGISCVLTTALPNLKKALELLKADNARPEIPVIIGGNCIDEQICRHVNADYWAGSATSGIQICRELFLDKI